ncbi:uncharacterized protein LOC126653472 [Mercurialis annua]|uniref:uncharacterized protein LOC126653472 n=1 Tax=Mercurialis annua TaxID=3986 RepID=UPI00215E367C|nr:uncharacterized protein LOC126653472 [Mercurialis annua]
MDSLASSVVLPPSSNPLHLQQQRCRLIPPSSSFYGRTFRLRFSSKREPGQVLCKLSSGPDHPEDENENEVDRALHLDGTIPGTSDEFVKQVSSRAYHMRSHLQQSFHTSTYDVLESNPWRETSKPVYVLTHRENQLCTMKTRTNRSEVERELGVLFSKGGKWRPERQNHAKQSRSSPDKFQMMVEDIREGVLVFEDENEAVKYCDLLQGGGKGCEGVAEIDASSVFDICRKMRALAVLFRRGRTPPLPQSLELNLRARKRSLEDQQDLI